MIRQLSFLTLAILIFISCRGQESKALIQNTPDTDSQSTKYEAAIAQSTQLTEKTIKKYNLPGVAVAVSVKGEMVWAKGFGYSNIEDTIAIDPYLSKFRIGSISKPFTATALGQLYEQKKLDFDAPVQDYVDYFPKKKYPLTVRQVAGHIGGIRHYKGDEFLSNKFYGSVKESLGIFQDDPLLFEPGSKYSYSSYGWNLISAVVEGASGEPFLPYMEQHVFKPLKMENTCADMAKEAVPNRVSFYELSGNEIELAPQVDNSYKWAGGGFLSSAGDVVLFGNAYLEKSILTAAGIEPLWTPLQTNDGKSTNYGIGWSRSEDKKGRKWVGHSGGSVGGTSMLILYPEAEMVVVVLCNLSSAKMDQLPFRIAEQFLMSSQR